MPRLLAFVAPVALLLSGCAVGPDYVGPPVAAPRAATAPAFQRVVSASVVADPPPARWWETLDDPLLTRLIEQSLAYSPTIHAAQAKLRAARASLGASRAAMLPSGGATGAAISARLPASATIALTGQRGGAADDFTLYSAGFDATWEIDLFGGTRRAIEGASAVVGARQASLADAQVQIAAEVGQGYVKLRAAQASLGLTHDEVALWRKTLELVRQSRGRGTVADGDVARVQASLASAEARIAPLEGEVEAQRDALAVLTGQEPGTLDHELAALVAMPTPPRETPIGDPAALLRRRPDIRQAERQLAASNATIGQNLANLFPKVQLLGDVSFTSTDAGEVFKGSNLAALGGPALTWGIFNAPRVMAQVRGARADRDAAADQYRATVLAALQDAENALSRYGGQRRSLASLLAVQAAAAQAAEIARQRYTGGTISLLDLLDAERQQVSAAQALDNGRADLTADWIALQKSLGLGWEAPA